MLTVLRFATLAAFLTCLYFTFSMIEAFKYGESVRSWGAYGWGMVAFWFFSVRLYERMKEEEQTTVAPTQNRYVRAPDEEDSPTQPQPKVNAQNRFVDEDED